MLLAVDALSLSGEGKGGMSTSKEESAPASGGTGRRRLPDAEYLALGLGDADRGGEIFVAPQLQAPAVGTRRQTPFGVLAPSLLEAFALDSALLDAAIPLLAPRCRRCGTLAQAPGDIHSFDLPPDGFLAAVLADERAEISLRERCELLGAERVLVAGKILRLEDAHCEDGEPVVCLVSASHPDELRAGVSLWMGRGSVHVRVLHLAGRADTATELGRFRPAWECLQCGESYPVATKLALSTLEACTRCKGGGWLEVEGGRLNACPDCDGFGSCSPLREYEWHGTQLRGMPAISFGQLAGRLDRGSWLARACRTVCEHGFSAYPVGAPVRALAAGERLRAALAVVALSQVTGASFVADGAAIFSDTEEAASVALCLPEPFLPPPRRPGGSSHSIIVRDIERGPISIAELSIPLGSLAAVQGDSGTGKRLLLHEIAGAFSKRKKLAHRCAFPGISACHVADLSLPPPELIGNLIGLLGPISGDLARSRLARERGLSAEQLSPATTVHRCPSCLDDACGDPCLECGGSGVSASVATLAFGSMSYGEILRAPLREIAPLLWSSDAVAGVINGLPEELSARISLTTRTADLSAPQRRALAVLAAVSRVLALRKGARPAPLNSQLLLLCSPMSLGRAHQEAAWGAICEANDRGATVICTNVPQALETSFASVVRLRPSGEAGPERMSHVMYDVRYSRAARAHTTAA